MQITNTKDTYGIVSQLLHWSIAILILSAIVMGKVAGGMEGSGAKISMYVFHKSAGVTVLVLVVLRILWKLMNPKTDAGLTDDQARKASVGHWLLYALMFLMPLSGWVLNSAANYPFGWMNLISVPMIPGISKSLQEPAEQIHELLFYALAAVVVGHILMVIYHKRFHQLNLLPRMLPGNGKTSSIALVLVVVAVLIPIGWLATKGNSQIETNKTTQTTSVSGSRVVVENSESPLWVAAIEDGSLAFKGVYSGEPFDGEFKRYDAKLYFDPQQPQAGAFDVVINTASVTTYTSDWDYTISGSEWFFVEQFPNAYYTANEFEVVDNGFIAKGELDIKGIRNPIDLAFQWQSTDSNTVIFNATATVPRVTFEIGSGSWAEDDSIGFDVEIHINMTLKPGE